MVSDQGEPRLLRTLAPVVRDHSFKGKSAVLCNYYTPSNSRIKSCHSCVSVPPFWLRSTWTCPSEPNPGFAHHPARPISHPASADRPKAPNPCNPPARHPAEAASCAAESVESVGTGRRMNGFKNPMLQVQDMQNLQFKTWYTWTMFCTLDAVA